MKSQHLDHNTLTNLHSCAQTARIALAQVSERLSNVPGHRDQRSMAAKAMAMAATVEEELAAELDPKSS